MYTIVRMALKVLQTRQPENQENNNSKAGDGDRRVAWDQREKNNNNGGVCKNEAYDQEVLGCSFNQMVGTGTVEPTESLCEEKFVQKGT